MVSRSSCLKLLRLTTYRRCLSTETAAMETVSTPTITQKTRKNDGRRMLSNLMNRADSEANLKDDLDKLHNEGKPLTKLEIIDCINHLRGTNRFGLALQVIIFHLFLCLIFLFSKKLSSYHDNVYIFHGDVFQQNHFHLSCLAGESEIFSEKMFIKY